MDFITYFKGQAQLSLKNTKDTGNEVAVQRKLRAYDNASDADVVVLDYERNLLHLRLGFLRPHDAMSRTRKNEKIEENSGRQSNCVASRYRAELRYPRGQVAVQQLIRSAALGKKSLPNCATLHATIL